MALLEKIRKKALDRRERSHRCRARCAGLAAVPHLLAHGLDLIQISQYERHYGIANVVTIALRLANQRHSVLRRWFVDLHAGLHGELKTAARVTLPVAHGAVNPHAGVIV
ncbi:hypothetical protein BN1708_000048 [Verticillium longisporum]|uniref:Uncharacterized protein n=1 Tax=Verticillium longisporum TaxID=100787 RepID=A0A0G4KDC0_VERLO|nr:hypothetical protein BN1708_000048 [Verticillium longisporum]